MFQFSGFASITGYCIFNTVGCPIRIFTDQWLFAPTRDFSQLITSFFASESQGIRHAPFFTFLVGVFLPKPVGNEIQTYTKALLLFCSVLVLLFESYVFQYVNERFDLFWSLWLCCCLQQDNLVPLCDVLYQDTYRTYRQYIYCLYCTMCFCCCSNGVVPRRFELRTPTLSV